MKILLDTHIWLWSALEPERLGKRLRRTLEFDEAELWLSPISVWEFLLLVARRRIVVTGEASDWVQASWARARMREAPLNRDVAIRSRAVRVPHEDPADRFLAATAEVFDLALATDDAHLLRGKGYRTIPNR